MGTANDRVRKRTAAAVLRRIDAVTIDRLTRLAGAEPQAIGVELERLDREWDSDRVIETEAALTGLAGLALAVLADRRYAALPAFVGAAVFLHAISGWHPLLPVLRRLGVRSAREIERERYAIKALRGDFGGMERGTGAGLHGSASAAAVAEDRA